ncbi:hypothetical protein N657DRAFT_678983 [Parathielavia appendiculata]|uniref:DUF7896 domain-containing protein n=1 Tax=Parathielavia appendiculata TaxID=2587402 RepID=A0AAN6U4S4_9PEZI|nr:hypothetical protein N657DRAFT_678983 [Parathielavia appendiculata]
MTWEEVRKKFGGQQFTPESKYASFVTPVFATPASWGAAVRSRWFCIEPRDQPPNALLPQVPLTQCAACLKRKPYDGYRDAAAHLRSAHFTQREGEHAEDWRLYLVLKDWMKTADDLENQNDAPRDTSAWDDLPLPLPPLQQQDEPTFSDALSDLDKVKVEFHYHQDAFTVHGESMDSGYPSAFASAGRQKESVREGNGDARTVYSDEGSIDGAELDAYKRELVDDLVNEARRLEAEPEALEKVFDAMPPLLKPFALALGQFGSTQAQRDVMYFVHKYRLELSCRFKESMLGFCEDDTTPDRERDPIDSEERSSRIIEWLVSLGAPGADESAPAPEPQAAAALPEDDEIRLPDKHGLSVVFSFGTFTATRLGEESRNLEANQDQHLEDVDVNVLRSSRHVIGWCSEVDYLAGDASANHDIRRSRLSFPGREFNLEKVSFSVGNIVAGGCQFAIGRKDLPVNISKQDHGYLAKLQWIEQRYVVLWDEEDKCGWLVKGTSALLHLLRASLKHCRNDKFSSEFLFDEKFFQEPNGEEFDETVTWPDGRQETVTKTRNSYATVEDRVVGIFESLEKLIDHEAHCEASAKGVSMKPWTRSHLQGWDFRDVATNRGPLYLRLTTPPSSGRVFWHSPSQHSPFAADGKSMDPEEWNPIQELLPADSKFRGLLSQIKGSETVYIDSCQHGAVIFVHLKSPRFAWPDNGGRSLSTNLRLFL